MNNYGRFDNVKLTSLHEIPVVDREFVLKRVYLLIQGRERVLDYLVVFTHLARVRGWREESTFEVGIWFLIFMKKYVKNLMARKK